LDKWVWNTKYTERARKKNYTQRHREKREAGKSEMESELLGKEDFMLLIFLFLLPLFSLYASVCRIKNKE
jgi:hypothetical protein